MSDYMAAQMDSQIEGAQSENEALRDEVERLREMVRWAYMKLHRVNYSNQEDALMLDSMKMLLEHGVY